MVTPMNAVVTVNAQGRLTIPAEIRRELGIEGESTLILEVAEGRLVARPGITIPAEDAWAFTPEHLERVTRAKAQAAAGQILQLTESELRQRIGLSPTRARKARQARPDA